MTSVRWTPGMRDTCGHVAFEAEGEMWLIDSSTLTGRVSGFTVEVVAVHVDDAPDMSHAGTRGEVLAQARDAWDEHDLRATYWRGDWDVSPDNADGESFGGDTEGEAIRAALDAAP